MNVIIKCGLNKRYPGTVYASVESEQELLVAATLDYCLSACEERGYTITNSQDVLMWLHRNADFKGHPA